METKRSRLLLFGLLSGLLAWPCLPSPVSAGGYEYPGGSPRGLGRGGTGFARGDDSMMAFLNPAALGSMPSQFIIGSHIAFIRACVDRTGNYDPSWTAGGATDIPHGNVCNGDSAGDRMTFIPQVAGTFRLHKMVGMALGIDPPLSFREMRYGQQTGSVNGNDVPGFINSSDGKNGVLPSPLRYMLVADNVVVVYPTIAIGVKPVDWFQFGVAFAAGFAHIKFNNYTRFQITGAAGNGENEENDTPTRVRVTDGFVPRLTGSVHFIPHDSLDIVGGVRYDGDVKADGQTKALVSTLGEAKGTVRYTAPRPMWIMFGLRYANRITPRAKLADATNKSGATDDPMVNENFDIELNVTYERNSEVKDHIFASGELNVFPPGGGAPTITIDPFETRIPHRWKDQVSVRLGGDWNPMPGKLAVRLGATYETLGFRDGFGFIDYYPMQRFGIHTGLSGRIGKVEMSLGYAHFFHTDFNNPNGEWRQVVIDLDGPREDGLVVNSGKYTAGFDIFTWSLRVIFD